MTTVVPTTPETTVVAATPAINTGRAGSIKPAQTLHIVLGGCFNHGSFAVLHTPFQGQTRIGCEGKED